MASVWVEQDGLKAAKVIGNLEPRCAQFAFDEYVAMIRRETGVEPVSLGPTEALFLHPSRKVTSVFVEYLSPPTGPEQNQPWHKGQAFILMTKRGVEAIRCDAVPASRAAQRPN